MNLDDKITRALDMEAKRLEHFLQDDSGLFTRLLPIYRGGMRRWVWLVNALAIVSSGFMFWSGFEFFVADSVEPRVFWGVCLLVSLQVQVGLKNWLMMEMNRDSLMRELKRIELVLVQQGQA